MPRISPLMARLWVVIVILSVAVAFAYVRWDRQHALSGVPSSIETTDELISTEAIAGFTEGCGFKVHRIADKTKYKILSEKLAFFAAARTGRDGGNYYRYKPWKVTPPTQEEHLLRGLRCVPITSPMEATLAKAIEHAAFSPGSYFSTGYEYDILVVPHLDLVVVSFSG